MHIIIPMSGTGKRFIKAGYERPKPLIIVDGKPIIEHVIEMFDAADRFTFICNRRHIEDTDMADILKVLIRKKIKGPAEIVVIEPHKQGPVFAVKQCYDRINDNEEVIVNYCDFYSYWDYQAFLSDTRGRHAAGAVPAYRGFHPHMLGTDNYAFIKDEKRWLQAIQEKEPFTDNRMAEYASNGTYFFAKGQYIKRFFDLLIDKKEQINGEYYVSMVYNLMVQDNLPVSVYEVQHMLQWGTPKDLEEYQHWSDYFTHLTNTPQAVSQKDLQTASVDICLIPAAGKGQRFADVGYTLPKPLIAVSGKPMIVQAAENLPLAKRYIFVTQKEHLKNSKLAQVLDKGFQNAAVVALKGITEGQAISCEVGLLEAKPPVDMEASLLIGACDNGIIFDQSKWQTLIEDQSIDAAALSFRHHPSSQRNPQMYGWLITENDQPCNNFPKVTGVSVKKAISEEPENDHAIVGAFFFRKVSYFIEALKTMKDQNIRVNGEFYVDSMMGVLAGLKKHCVVFEVDDYICFGTPNDLATFEYWQAFFHKCKWHPYTIENDPLASKNNPNLQKMVNKNMVQQ